MSSTFSESWYNVAKARLSLLPTVGVHKQRFRGNDWYVLRDAYTQRFFRISPQAYAFVSRLSSDRTVDEVWRTCLDEFPEQAPGQEEVMMVLSQLHHANLLHYRSRADGGAIFERYRSFKQREFKSQLLGFLYLRVPLWDPNDWLNRHRDWVERLVNWWPLAIMVLTMMVGLGVAAVHADGFAQHTQGMFTINNLFWLYLCMAVMKGLHEMAHAFAVKKFGGEVHTVGLMFLVFVPLPYVDATGSWAFRSQHARALVGAIGIIIELFLAALGAIVWGFTGPGLINSLAFNVMLLGSVSSLVFNGNPLLRFDAYYVLSDLLDIPNLYQKASQQWFYLADKYLLGTESAESPARDSREWWWMTSYGLLSFVYRMLIMFGIVTFVADQWFALGVIFAFTTFLMVLVMPLHKLVGHLRGPTLYRNRLRAVSVVAGLVALPMAFVAWVPIPLTIRAPGMVEAVQYTRMATSSGARLEQVLVPSGQQVQAGEALVKLSSPELDWDLEIVRQQLHETDILLNKALVNSPGEIEPLQKRMQSLREREAEFMNRRSLLNVKAKHDGTWVSPQLHHHLGSWLPRGEALGELVNHQSLRFTAIISQDQANRLFGQTHHEAELRLSGQADHMIKPQQILLLPYQKQDLPSAALGWLGGGTVPVKTEEPSGTRTLESFYEVHASLPAELQARALHGVTGWIRIELPGQTLWMQLRTAFMQLMQKRYQL